MNSTTRPRNFEEFRVSAKRLMGKNIAPERVQFANQDLGLFSNDLQHETDMFLNLAQSQIGNAFPQQAPFFIRKDQFRLLESVSLHRSEDVWDLLYRIIWKLREFGPNFLDNLAHPDVLDLMRRKKQISRDIHKMHAFVRFRKLGSSNQQEKFVAWHKPEHKIVRVGAIFFKKRFPNMVWSILSPDESVHWDCKKLTYTEGVAEDPIVNEDSFESWWLTYYESIFNPARVKIKAMKNEMPVKYWESLPETKIINRIVKEAPIRLKEMQDRAATKVISKPQGSFDEIKASCEACKNCEISKLGGKAIFGEGPSDAEIMVVGEQAGDEEDLSGKVFVGPAGKVLSKMFLESDLNREDLFITNAVKHFKWTQRGSRRLHQRPSGNEILSCRSWLLAEIDLIKPKVIICLGRVAAQSILGIQINVSEVGLKVFKGFYDTKILVTYHPASLLRATSERERTLQKSQVLETFRFARKLIDGSLN